MKIGIFSDLHLEFQDWDFTPDPEIFYICAGDIHPNYDKRQEFLDRFNGKIFYVKGNHDFYGNSFNEQEMRSVKINDTRIAGTTLWTDLSSTNEWIIYKQCLYDAKVIQNLDFSIYHQVHGIQKRFLLESEADIVVSHHGPTSMSIHPKYAGNFMNCCFTNNYENDILNLQSQPKLWIHGHTHERLDYMVGNTRVICHPRGYPGEQSWYDYYEPLILEIE